MRERVEQLVGGVARRDVGDDLPLGLRADPARRRRAARLQARLHDLRRGRLAADGQALHRGARTSTRSASRRAPIEPQISAREEPARRRGGLRARRRARSSSETVADVYRLYERRMLEANAMDFDDLLVRTVNLLELFADVRERYRRTFRWVLVDEYQDTNHAQYRLLQLLAGEHGNLIGGRRRRPVDLRASATPTSATSSTSSATSRTPTVVKLEQNYRSTQTILYAANAVDRPQPRAAAEAALDRDRARRAGDDRRARRRARGGALGRRRRSSGSRARRGSRATRSRSSTGPTRRAGCSRTRSSASRSPTR